MIGRSFSQDLKVILFSLALGNLNTQGNSNISAAQAPWG